MQTFDKNCLSHIRKFRLFLEKAIFSNFLKFQAELTVSRVWHKNPTLCCPHPPETYQQIKIRVICTEKRNKSLLRHNSIWCKILHYSSIEIKAENKMFTISEFREQPCWRRCYLSHPVFVKIIMIGVKSWLCRICLTNSPAKEIPWSGWLLKNLHYPLICFSSCPH